MRKFCLFLALACCISLFGCSKTPEASPTAPTTGHIHTFGEWKLQESASCLSDGREDRRCSGCGFTESRPIGRLRHQYNTKGICRVCRYVEFDKDASLVELGVVCDEWYTKNLVARHVWDLKIWQGKLYRAAGDYDGNSGDTVILSYDLATQRWDTTQSVPDEAIQGFVEIGGKLYAPGVDATGSWDYANYYVLEDGVWTLMRNIPGGIHNFDMIEHDGKIFAAVGTKKKGNTVAVSEDGGKTFQYVPLYKDGQPYPMAGCQYTRTYELVKHNGQVYAVIQLQLDISVMIAIFRYEDGKMHYMANAHSLFVSSVDKKPFGSEFEFNGTYYITTTGLFAITDFSDPSTWKKILVSQRDVSVQDALLWNGAIYVLASYTNRGPTQFTESYTAVIYKSTTGQEGSFEEVLSFNYPARALCFEYDGTYFYIGTGTAISKESAKTGMVLRAKAPA